MDEEELINELIHDRWLQLGCLIVFIFFCSDRFAKLVINRTVNPIP